MSSASPIDNRLLVLFYLFSDREDFDENIYTLEFSFDVKSGEGTILLWTHCEKEPRTVGTVSVVMRQCEGAIFFDRLPPQLSREDLAGYSFDLTTCFFDPVGGLYEEFYYSSFYFSDITGY